MNIKDDGKFEVLVDRVDLTGVVDLSNPERRYVSFHVEIGGNLQGVGIIFNADGTCAEANGSGGCRKVKI